MNTERVTWLRARLMLYNEKRQSSLYQLPYERAIEILNEELVKELAHSESLGLHLLG